MKDSQTVLKTPAGSIPFISTLLHVGSMPLTVVFRHGFGYLYLSPKKIFLSLTFVQALFAYMVWHDPVLKGLAYPSVTGSIVSLLYLIHLAIAIVQQRKGSAEHDQFAGKSWLLLLLPKSQREKLEPAVHGAIEPLIGAFTGLILFSSWLGPFLLVSSGCLALKELIRAWLALRTRKRMADNLIDVEDNIKLGRPGDLRPITPKGRTAPERHLRRYDEEVESEPTVEEHARELRLMPPYSLAQAEKHFRMLSADLNTEAPADAARLRRMEAALAYFQKL